MNLKRMRNGLNWLMLVPFFVLSMACGEKARIQELLQVEKSKTETAITELARKIDAKSLRNLVLLDEYASLLSKEKPEFKEIARAMALEGSTKGNLFKNLKSRMTSGDTQLVKGVAIQNQWKGILSEYQLIREAANPEMFNDALTDPINVLADLSDDRLARVQSIDRLTSQRANGARDYGAGSQLMGNPNYGQWRTGSNGLSFWEWYGIYALFSNFGGGPHYYRNWSRYRDYSYYSDYGRNHYTSYSRKSKQNQLETRTRKSFGQKGKPFKSPYAKQRVGSSGVSRVSKSNYSSAKRSTFSSSYAKSSSKSSSKSFSKPKSSSAGSFRNSSQRVSRGSMFGK